MGFSYWQTFLCSLHALLLSADRGIVNPSVAWRMLELTWCLRRVGQEYFLGRLRAGFESRRESLEFEVTTAYPRGTEGCMESHSDM